MKLQFDTVKIFVLLAALGLPGCRAIVGTVAIGTAAVVGTVGLAGYTVYKGGEAAVSAVGAVGTSTKKTVDSVVVSKGTLKTKSKYSVSELYPAAVTVLEQAGFQDARGRQDSLTGQLRAKTAFNEDVYVAFKLLEKNRTAVEILVGDGNLKQSEYLYDQMLALLAENEKGGRE